jgi:hypothetical protein
MKEFLKSFAGGFVGAMTAFGLVYWRVLVWFKRPLGPHLEIKELLPPDYENYWDYIKPYGVSAIVEGIMITLILVMILIGVIKIYEEIRAWRGQR